MVPNANEEFSLAQTANLGDVLSRHSSFFADHKLLLIIIKSPKIESIAAPERKGVRLVSLHYFVDICIEWAALVDFGELLALQFYYVNETLVLTAYECCFIDQRYCEDKVLGRHLVNYIKRLDVYHVKHLLFSSDKKITSNNYAETHVLNVKLFYSFWITSSENVDLVLAVNCDYVLTAYCIYMTSCLTLVLAMQLWLSLLKESIL